MPYKDLRLISNSILGEEFAATFEKKVLLVMYYSELLALNFKEIDALFQTHSRERLFNIFYLDANFVEHVYALFLNSEIDTIMPEIFDRLIRIQELLHQRKLLKSCDTLGLAQ
jgi:hypothetical protein